MVAPTGNVNYSQIQSTVNKLKSGGKVGYNQLMTYILNPYITQLGYNIYDLETTELDFDNGNIHIVVNDKLSVAFTLEEGIEYTLADSDADKIILFFDYETSTMTLKFKVLGAWKEVETVRFANPIEDGEDSPQLAKGEQSKFVKLNKYITRSEVIGQQKSKGERFFTEAVVDGLLDKGVWDNEFLRTSLANELKTPSEEMITLLAARLVKDYTTQSAEKVAEKLKPILETGLATVVDAIVENGMIPTSDFGVHNNYTNNSYTPDTKKEQEPKVEAPVVEKPAESVKDTFKNLGLKTEEKESEKPVEKKVSLEDLAAENEKVKEEEKAVEPRKVEYSSDGAISLDELLD